MYRRKPQGLARGQVGLPSSGGRSGTMVPQKPISRFWRKAASPYLKTIL